MNIGGLVVQIDAGAQHTCVLLDTGAVRCWGKWSDALGYGLSEDIGDDEHPADVGDVDVGGTVTSIAVGSGHSCALLDTGVVRCWGGNDVGQLGYPNADAEEPGPDVNVGGVVEQLLAGSGTTCAILDSGAVRCWGYGTTGNLGYGNIQNIGDDEHPVVAGNVPIF